MRSSTFFGLGVVGIGAIVGTALAGACNVYNDSLLTPGSGGAGATTTTTTTTTSWTEGGYGGQVGCTTPSQCPGEDGECGTRTCDGGVCGMNAVAQGTPVAAQTPGDCLKQVCDGVGRIVGIADDTDVPNDNNDCTADGCQGGIVHHDAVPEGSPCVGPGSGQVCNSIGTCVQCLDGSNCPSQVCTQAWECAPATCGDGVQNGQETDTDCGGLQCPKCAIGDTCQVAGDCLSGSCNVTCQPSCSDGILNQDESDLDCGGVCPPCAFGQHCATGSDCQTGSCSPGSNCTCPANNGVLLLSELRLRGPAGGNDDFVELYNPGNAGVTLTNQWLIKSRSDAASSYTTRFTGAGQVVPPRAHFLIVGSAYSGAVAGDANLLSGITDKASVVLENAGGTVDAVCSYCGANPFNGTYTCEGTPMENPGCTSNVDRSIERKPGGPLGNCIDTGVSLDDFQQITPSTPQDLASPPT